MRVIKFMLQISKGYLILKQTIQAFPPRNPQFGFEITYSKDSGRKSFHLPPLVAKSKPVPLAIESFAMDPDHYAELMKSVESLHKKTKQ